MIKKNHLTIKYYADPNMHSQESHKGVSPKIYKEKHFHKDNWIDAFEFALECSFLLTRSNHIQHLLPSYAAKIIKYYFPSKDSDLHYFNAAADRRSKMKFEMLKLYK